MNELSPFANVLAHLQKHEVNFIVCGGLAVAFCGFVRVTEDIDILVSVDQSNVKRLLRALTEFGDGLGGSLAESDFTLEPGCLEINEPECRIDIFTMMDSKSYEDHLPECQSFQAESLVEPVIHLSRKQLISAKSSTLRAKDLIDVDELKRLEE